LKLSEIFQTVVSANFAVEAFFKMKNEHFGSRNVLVPFLNLLLLESCKRTSPLNHPFQVLLKSGVNAQF